jgi:hypothetical protein
MSDIDGRLIVCPFRVDETAIGIRDTECNVDAALAAAKEHPDIRNPKAEEIFHMNANCHGERALEFEYHPPDYRKFMAIAKHRGSYFDKNDAILKATGLDKIKTDTQPTRELEDQDHDSY